MYIYKYIKRVTTNFDLYFILNRIQPDNKAHVYIIYNRFLNFGCSIKNFTLGLKFVTFREIHWIKSENFFC